MATCITTKYKKELLLIILSYNPPKGYATIIVPRIITLSSREPVHWVNDSDPHLHDDALSAQLYGYWIYASRKFFLRSYFYRKPYYFYKGN